MTDPKVELAAALRSCKFGLMRPLWQDLPATVRAAWLDRAEYIMDRLSEKGLSVGPIAAIDATADKAEPISDNVHRDAKEGLAALITARDKFVSAGASRRMVDRIRAAISSARGAVLHARDRQAGMV